MNGLSRVIILTDRSLDLLFVILGYIVQHLFGALDVQILFHRTLWMVVPNYISIDMCKVIINFYTLVL